MYFIHMGIGEFSQRTGLAKEPELARVCLLAFYHLKVNGDIEFTLKDVSNWFQVCHFAKPNESRLRSRLSKSTQVVKGVLPGAFKLHAKEIARLSAIYPEVGTSPEIVVSQGSILPDSLYLQTRGFIESLANQINASYEHNIFDGCAVLMRRLLEILLILSYQHLGIEAEVKDGTGNYYLMDGIAANAKANVKLDLSRNTKSSLEGFRKLGNFAAHKIHYNTRKQDIDVLKQDYRATIEELLYKSAIRS